MHGSVSGLGKGSCCPFFFPVFLGICGILSAFIHPPLQSLAVPPPRPEDPQGNHSLELLEPLEERLEGQSQQDTSQVRFSKDFRPVMDWEGLGCKSECWDGFSKSLENTRELLEQAGWE